MAKLTVVDAARVTGVSRSQLYRYIKAGRLSRTPDGLIDTAELLRAGLMLHVPSVPSTVPEIHDATAIHVSSVPEPVSSVPSANTATLERLIDVLQRELERIRISFLCCPCSPLSRDQGGAQGSEGKQVTRVAGGGIATCHGTQQTASRQRHLQADLPRSLGALPAAPAALPGSPRAGRDRQNARLWHPGGGLYDVPVSALPRRETGGVQL